MRSIKRRYEIQRNKDHGSSSYVDFAEAIKGQKFSKKNIDFWFNELVEKDDYSNKEKKALLENLYSLSNTSVEGVKQGEIAS